MPSTQLLIKARFEAARSLQEVAGRAHLARLHGHGFEAVVRTESGLGCPVFEGDELRASEEALELALTPLNYQNLNEVLQCAPGDASLAVWLYQRLSDASLSQVNQVEISSTANQGVILRCQDEKLEQCSWRRYRFEASHRLTGVPMSHKCAKMHGHGFEVRLQLSQLYAGAASNEQIVYAQLDAAWFPLYTQLHHTCLNELEALDNPTSEALTLWIWQRLKPKLPQLSCVDVYETASSGARFDGAMHHVWKEFSFDSALYLNNAPETDKRAYTFGHTYRVKIQLARQDLSPEGWVLDFYDIKTAFDPIFRCLDHQTLNQLGALASGDIQEIGRWLFIQVASEIPLLCAIELWETPVAGVLVELSPE